MVKKSIDTLVEDVYELLETGVDMTDDEVDDLGRMLGEAVRHSLRREHKPTLRMSMIGQPCNRKLYYEINHPEDKQPLKGPQYMKFLTGHILEEILLWLVEKAGHSVEGRQDEMEISGIKGHRDAVVDGMTIDVKSASTYSFQKFKEHRLAEDDPFGYMTQLQSYIEAGQDDPKVKIKDEGAFLVIDKTLGNICLDRYKKASFPLDKLYDYKKDVVSRPEPPARGFEDIPEGKSGNRKLGVNCSYCDFKNKCYPNLRTFLYAKGPVFLTKVVKEPNVPEFTGEEGQGEMGED